MKNIISQYIRNEMQQVLMNHKNAYPETTEIFQLMWSNRWTASHKQMFLQQNKVVSTNNKSFYRLYTFLLPHQRNFEQSSLVAAPLCCPLRNTNALTFQLLVQVITFSSTDFLIKMILMFSYCKLSSVSIQFFFTFTVIKFLMNKCGM